MCWNDLAWWTYLITVVVSAYGTWLFTWWSAKNGFHTSSVFMYTQLWLAGTFIQGAVELYARTLTISDPSDFAEFAVTVWWPMRKLIVIAIITVLCVHMTIRVYRHEKKDNGCNGDN